MEAYNPPHFRDENTWDPIPESEVERLQGTSSNHLRKIGVKLTKSQRIDFVKELLSKQNHTCAYGSEVGGKWCWNEPKENFTKTKTKKGE